MNGNGWLQYVECLVVTLIDVRILRESNSLATTRSSIQMNVFRIIINIIILLFALAFLTVGIRQFLEIFDGFDKLTTHKGVLSNKWLREKYFFRYNSRTKQEETNDSSGIFCFTVFDGTITYTASWNVDELDRLLQPGDSMVFYTKPVTSKIGNFVTNGKSRVWNTHSPYEVYHLQSNKYDTPLMDYKDHLSHLKHTVWLWPLFSIILLGWYLYRRSGTKSPLVMESIN